jgi:hypothetical protein
MKISILKLEWRRREDGGGATQRDFLDFVVDGESLYEKISRGNISPLGWFTEEENLKAVNRLLLKEKSELPDNRHSLYVCAECGDLSCGAITAVIEKEKDKIIWHNFGFQNDYEEKIYPIEFSEVFIFDKAQYESAIKSAL